MIQIVYGVVLVFVLVRLMKLDPEPPVSSAASRTDTCPTCEMPWTLAAKIGCAACGVEPPVSAAQMREALAEALDLLEDTAYGKVHDGQQAWQDAYARIHDAAGKPERQPKPRPWEVTS